MYCTKNLEAAQSAGQRATPAASWQPKAAQASRQREGRVVDVSAAGAPLVPSRSFLRATLQGLPGKQAGALMTCIL